MPSKVELKLIEQLARLRENVSKVFLGREQVIDQLIVGLLAGGHVLVEDVPGVGKTILARALAKSIDCTFSRIQLTPDLLPSDIIGVSIYNELTREFEFKQGPIFANIILADEVNRTTPRTQSAMLEAMNEGQISVDNSTFTLEKPFMVIATQNPFEFEGTYLLPENQLDRFILRITIGYPSPEQEAKIILEQPAKVALKFLEPVLSGTDVIALQSMVDQVHVSPEIMEYTLRFITATRNHKHLDLGVSPRGGQALIRASQALAMIEKRDYVIPEDIKQMAVPVCAHRVLSKSYLDESQSSSTSSVITQILNEISVPI
jgi:MoxR-like ATPase